MNNTLRKKRFDELDSEMSASELGTGEGNSVAKRTTTGYKPTVNQLNSGSAGIVGSGTAVSTTPTAERDYLDQALDMLSKQPAATYTPGVYQSQYSEQIDSIINDILNSKYQGYDPTTDPTYSQYKKTYLREADRTAEDVIGQYAAMNGGMPSTAAISAASQAGNIFKGQLADKIPELEAAAYERYLSELSGKRQNLSELTALEELAYGRFADEENRKLVEYQQKQNEFDTALNRLLQSAEIARGKEDSEEQKALTSGFANAGLSEDTILKLLEYSSENDVSPMDALLQFNEIASTSGGGNQSEETESGGLLAIKKKAATFDNEADLDNYLTRLVSNGLITKEKAFSIFEELLNPEKEKQQTADEIPLQKRNWKLVDSGGNNWGGGIDNNAKVKDQFGNVFRLDDLVDALVESGMSKKEAKAYVQLMQVQVGAVKS